LRNAISRPFDNDEISKLPIMTRIERDQRDRVELLLLSNEVLRFRNIVNLKAEIAVLPNSLGRLFNGTRGLIRSIERESVFVGVSGVNNGVSCFLYRKLDLFPLLLNIPLMWKPMYYLRHGVRRPTGHTRVKIKLEDLPERLISITGNYMPVGSALLVNYSHYVPWKIEVSSPSCLICYGEAVDVSFVDLTGDEHYFSMDQGDMCYLNQGVLNMKPTAEEDLDNETQLLLLST